MTITPIASANGPSVRPAPTPIPHIDQPPAVTTLDKALTERAGVTGSSAVDTTSGTISFADINLGDRPTATATFTFVHLSERAAPDITPLNAQQLADIEAVEDPAGRGAGSGQHHQRHRDLDLQCPGQGFRLPRRRRDADADLYGGSRQSITPPSNLATLFRSRSRSPAPTTLRSSPRGRKRSRLLTSARPRPAPYLPPSGPDHEQS